MQNMFWLVWNPEGRNPLCRHQTETQAEEEAQRLARSNPGEEFFVLLALARAVKTDVLFERLNDPEQQPPF